MLSSRRDFLRRSSTFAAGFCALRHCLVSPALANSTPSIAPYGPLGLDPNGILDLPQGFTYRVISTSGSTMSDGLITPGLPDGMATFAGPDELTMLVRNHELLPFEGPGAFGKMNELFGKVDPQKLYDRGKGQFPHRGGTSTIVYDTKNQKVVRDFMSLAGTSRNCAGGPTPWNSWITCEETVIRSGPGTDGEYFCDHDHGYCFEVFASANNAVSPVPLKAMGRFVHEAIAVDRKKGVVYLTEDANSAGFYRFLPKRNKRLAEGGVLQILKIKEQDAYDTRKGQKTGMSFMANWVTISNPDPIEADLDPLAVYKEGLAKGAATFARLEGIWADKKGRMYFDATSGGDAKAGQIWLYESINKDEGRLTLLFESPSRQILDMPDNICLHPKNDLLFICEDSDYAELGGKPDNFIRILTKDGKIADFAKNVAEKKESSEFAGSVFSKDGKILFVNLQTVGSTFAIWGDWQAFRK